MVQPSHAVGIVIQRKGLRRSRGMKADLFLLLAISSSVLPAKGVVLTSYCCSHF
jgi:hypothetical protein